MIELGPGADLLRMVGGIFWLVVIGAFVAAALIPKTKKSKAIAVAGVTLLFLAFPGRWAWEMKREANAIETRLAKAEAMFQERCKTAGEKIYRTVEGVEGIFLMKLRPSEINYGDQFKMDDPYGLDSGGDTYIKVFFAAFYRIPSNPPKGWEPRRGYHYVEALDPKDSKRYRYTGRIDQPWLRDKRYGEWVREFVLEKNPATGAAPRYGVTYDDISTREEREQWIAGSSLKVIDLQTNEVMAERIGYMMDRKQGAREGGRSPWLLAANNACPKFPADPSGHPIQTDQTHDFVVKVLKPIQEK